MVRMTILVVAGLMVTSAFAMAPAKKEDDGPKLKSYLLTSHGTDLQTTADELVAKSQSTNEEFGKATDHYLTKLSEAEKLRKDAGEASAKAQASLKKGEDELDAINKELTDLEKKQLRVGSLDSQDIDSLDKLGSRKTTLQGEVAKARTLADSLKAEEGRATQYLEEVRGKIQTQYKSHIGENARIQTADDVDGLRKQLATSLRAQTLRDIESVTNQLFDKVQSDYFKSGLLSADLKYLESEYKMTGERMDILKKVSNEKLNRTLVGNFVNTQIAKAMSNICSIRAQCDSTASAEEKARGISDLIRKLLDDPTLAPGAVKSGPATQTIKGK